MNGIPTAEKAGTGEPTGRVCAYCGAAGRTREHIFPAFLRDHFPGHNTFVDNTRGKVLVGAAPTIRDVCEACNNGPLAQLDGYGAELAREYFTQAVELGPVRVTFVADFHRLLRWLLKLSFNDARSRRKGDSFKPFVPYILGRAAQAPIPTHLLVGMIAPVVSTSAERSAGHDEVIRPHVHRMADLTPPPLVAPHLALGRFFGFHSYVLKVLAWKPETPPVIRRRNVCGIADHHRMLELTERDNATGVVIERAYRDDARTYLLTGVPRIFGTTPGSR
jgi:hypothetical protein